MKIVFLDIDGVLNGDYYLPDFESATFGTDAWWAAEIDPERVQLLNQIVSRSGAKIVVSSAWRFGKPPERLQRILDKRGFKGSVVARTTTEFKGTRGLQIRDWLDNNETDSFVILDDASKDDIHPYEDEFVQTDYATGLTPVDVETALEILD